MRENRYREAVVATPVEDLHALPKVKSELVTQAILGMPLVVGKERQFWLWVTTPDAYRGWIAESATRRLRPHEPRYASRGRAVVVTSNTALVHIEGHRKSRTRVMATVGARMELVKKQGNRLIVKLPDRRVGWVTEKDAQVRDAEFRYRKTSRRKVVDTAKRFRGVPYLWGGTTPLGFDCSGLVQLAYRLNGFELPRDADQQFQVSAPIDVSEMKPADLVFFSDHGTGITHVGIFVPSRKFLHASGRFKRVTVTPFDDPYFQSVFVEPRRIIHDEH